MKCLVCNKSVKQGLRLVKGEKTISTISVLIPVIRNFGQMLKGSIH